MNKPNLYEQLRARLLNNRVIAWSVLALLIIWLAVKFANDLFDLMGTNNGGAANKDVAEEKNIANDRLQKILADMENDKDRALYAIAARNQLRDPYPLVLAEQTPEFQGIAKIEAKYTTEGSFLEEAFDNAVTQLRSLHAAYITAIDNKERIRANELRNQINEKALRFQFEVLLATNSPADSKTKQLTERISHLINKGGSYYDDPVSSDDDVHAILREVAQETLITVEDAAALRSAGNSKVGERIKATGECTLLRPGSTNEQSIARLDAPSEGKEIIHVIAFFEWGWNGILNNICMPRAKVEVVGYVSSRSSQTVILHKSSVPGRNPEAFQYASPHYGILGLSLDKKSK